MFAHLAVVYDTPRRKAGWSSSSRRLEPSSIRLSSSWSSFMTPLSVVYGSAVVPTHLLSQSFSFPAFKSYLPFDRYPICHFFLNSLCISVYPPFSNFLSHPSLISHPTLASHCFIDCQLIRKDREKSCNEVNIPASRLPSKLPRHLLSTSGAGRSRIEMQRNFVCDATAKLHHARLLSPATSC